MAPSNGQPKLGRSAAPRFTSPLPPRRSCQKSAQAVKARREMSRSMRVCSSPASPVAIGLPDPNEVANVALLSGTIVEEPLRDESRDGAPITVLLVSFDAPDEVEGQALAVCEVEVPDEIADEQRGQLRPGGRLVVLGQLTGAGGLWASAIVTRPSRSSPR